MHKIILTFKENITDILIFFVFLTLIIVLALASASAQDVPSNTSICKEIEQGRYQNLSKLLKPTSSLRNIKLNNNDEPIYTGQQTVELLALETECGFRIIPFTGLFIDSIEEIENIYTKFYKS